MSASGSGHTGKLEPDRPCPEYGSVALQPRRECFDHCFAVLLTGSKADIGGLACNVALDFVKRTDTVESLSRDLGFVRGPDIMEVQCAQQAASRKRPMPSAPGS